MKTEVQIQILLSSQPIKTQSDWELIRSSCSDKLGINFKSLVKYEEDGMSAYDFLNWYDNGPGTGDVVMYRDVPYLVGKTLVSSSHLVSRITDSINDCDITADNSELFAPKDSVLKKAEKLIASQLLQFDYGKLSLSHKHIPKVMERVRYKSEKDEGIGIVWECNVDKGTVTMACCYSITSDTISYRSSNMTELSLEEYTFLPMTINDLRKLNKNLNRYGKQWNDKLHRVEPEQLQVEKGRPYWYITDKMTAVKATEKLTPTSVYRARSGNYFPELKDCLEALGKINMVIRDTLSK